MDIAYIDGKVPQHIEGDYDDERQEAGKIYGLGDACHKCG